MENNMTDIVRKHIIFHGSVQGVGFRYYSEHKANQLRLTGWVKNLYNGDVEMEVQGSEAARKNILLQTSAEALRL